MYIDLKTFLDIFDSDCIFQDVEHFNEVTAIVDRTFKFMYAQDNNTRIFNRLTNPVCVYIIGLVRIFLFIWETVLRASPTPEWRHTPKVHLSHRDRCAEQQHGGVSYSLDQALADSAREEV